MATGGNLYPNWLGSASLSLPTNTITTNVNVQGIGSYTTTVNVVPQILLSSLSSAVLNTDNPSEILSYTIPASGWYKSDWNGTASHASGSNWTSMSQLVWHVKKNGSVQSNTQTLVEPANIAGATVSEFIHIPGMGITQANAGDVFEYTTAATSAGAAITAGFSSGFGWITLQKIA